MRTILEQPGFLSVQRGGQRLRVLYRQNSITFNPALLTEFAQACFTGALEEVQKAVELGTAPDLKGTETGYQYGYAALVLFGAQRLSASPGSPPMNPLGTLKYLLEHGASPDVPDIIGYSPLHHACMAYPRADIARVLLEHGANPNAQDRFGTVPLIGAFQNNSIDAIEVLMEFGARLDVRDADGFTPDTHYPQCGSRVVAVIEKWKRRRAGTENPTDVKACTACGKSDGPLKWCSKCYAIWYCSKECQKIDWPTHKRSCIPFNMENTVTLKPVYDDGITMLLPVANTARQMLGHPNTGRPSHNNAGVAIPHIQRGQTRALIIKVQIPFDVRTGRGQENAVDDLMVYDKRRTLVCRVRRADNPDGYARITQVVRAKGFMGAKAYFSAEMKSADELVVKVSEVLAEQAF
ncbi:ankyrin [Trametes meyenii]|nr:ankyrin [Trametes meyenii]